MAQTAATAATASSTAPPVRPGADDRGQEAAPSPVAAGPVPKEPNSGRTAAIGAAIGFVVATVGVGVAGMVGGLDAGPAFGLGAFGGIWGGAGFGFMMGGTVPFALHMDAMHAASHTASPSREANWGQEGGSLRGSHEDHDAAGTGPGAR